MLDQATFDYLSRYQVLRTRDLDESRAVMSGIWGDHKVMPTTRMPFATVVNHARMGQAGLTFVDCRTPLLIECVSDCDAYTIGFHDEGRSRHTVGGHTAVSAPDSAVIWSPGDDLRIASEGARTLCLSLPRRGVEEGLDVQGSGLLRHGRPAPPIDPRIGAGAALHSLCRWAAHELDKPYTPLLSGPASQHLEQTLLTLFLQALASRNPTTAAGRCEMLGRIRLSDLESWIEANLREPISIETLAGVAGVSTRAVQMAFRRHRGCTPLAFVRHARLRRIRREILLRGPRAVVTDIALEFGFLHLGRFAHAYRQVFGEHPSETLRHIRVRGATPRGPAND